MIILDTEVVSEIMRGSAASPAVRATRDHGGHARRDPRWRRAAARRAATRPDRVGGDSRIRHPRRLLAASACAAQYADIVATRRSAGRPIGAMDARIAAIARFSGSALATRDTEDFEHLGLNLVDPWNERT